MAEKLGRYEILEEIGQGGFAVVYRGRDTELERLVALKELRQPLLQDTEWVKRFKREAQTIARLDHPRIVTVFDVTEISGRLLIVMRLIDGVSLDVLLEQQGPLPWQQTLRFMSAIADGLDFAHNQGFLHRDLKPANILLDSKRGPLLADFGLARLMEQAGASFTATGSIVGTPHYIAPEVWNGEASTPRSDIYALGCILYEMLTGKKAAQGESPPAIMMAHFNPLSLPNQWPNKIPPGISQVLQTALARRPDDRYTTAGELAAALTALSPSDTGYASPTTASHPAASIAPAVKKSNLPSHPTPFIGRTCEITEITDLLNRPTCRLLTLLGPGGIGKTRLAAQVTARQKEAYKHGICFVSLQAAETTDLFIATIADALKFPLAGEAAFITQLLNYLRNKELLLVLDNFEQLLPEQGQLVLPDLLAAASGVKLLVTSREALHLQEEWVFRVEGLSFPQTTQTGDFSRCEAVQLFEQRAQHVRPDFALATHLADVVHICRLVEGTPLAIELAAAWTKMLTCRAIAAEISRNLDLLTTHHRNVPDRQQSMRMIFDQTWLRLSRPERDVFRRLSVFKGGFRRQAAEQVAGASLPLLSMLQDKALLRWQSSGRYYTHELLRQYAAEQLGQAAEELARIKEAHCTYFADYMHEYNPDFGRYPQREAITAIGTELENIRAAWQYAVREKKLGHIKKMARPLGIFCNFQSRYAEGLKAYENLVGQLTALPETEESGLVLADVLMAKSWLQLRFGHLDDLEAAMRQSEEIYRRLNREPAAGYITDPAIILSFAALIRGDYAAAGDLAEQARQTGKRLDHPFDHEFACYLLAQVALAQGQVDTAQDYAQKAHQIGQAAGDRWFLAYVLNTLGDISCATQQYSQAQQHYQAAFDIRREFNDAEGMALALNHLGQVALRQATYSQAHNFFEQSLTLYQEINDTGGLATLYHHLGSTALALGDFDAARHNFCRALRLAADIHYQPVILTTLVSIGELLCRTQQPQRGIGLFTLVEHQTAVNEETRSRAAQLRNSFKLQVAPKKLAAAKAQAQIADLETTLATLLAELPTLDLTAPPTETNESPADPNQALVEPLTEREREVLHLLAEGLSNQEIAARLTLAEGTVKYYTRQIYAKLQVRSRIQAVSVARDLGLV